MKLFLIRHGESIQDTKENYELNLPDHKVYLTDNGKNQAHLTGRFLKLYTESRDIDLNKSILFVSPFERTRKTAEIINKYLKINKVKEDITLIEQQYGLFSDKSIDDIKKMYPDQFAFYDNYYQNDGQFYAKFPQGESPFDVALRTRIFINSLEKLKEENFFVVSHGTTIRTIIMNLNNYPPEWFNSEPNMKNCSVRLIDDNTSGEYICGGPVNKIKTYYKRKKIY